MMGGSHMGHSKDAGFYLEMWAKEGHDLTWISAGPLWPRAEAGRPEKRQA